MPGDSPQRAGPIAWEVLVEGRDYYLDPSGLWFALASRLDQEDFLAVSYITAAGDTVGTFPAEERAGTVDTLELIHLPRTGPEVPTFFYEMRNVYRVGSVDDITRTSVAASVAVGGSQRPEGGAATFLALLGVAQENDATVFDQYNRIHGSAFSESAPLGWASSSRIIQSPSPKSLPRLPGIAT